jgi:hypothetical protein
MGAGHLKREGFNLKEILWQDIQDQERGFAGDWNFLFLNLLNLGISGKIIPRDSKVREGAENSQTMAFS